jgi:cyclophilin family peptidyl-prolyl cis-trans isomerase
MSLGNLSSGGPGADRKRKLGVLAALAIVVLVLMGISRLAGGGDEALFDPTTTTAGPDDTTEPTATVEDVDEADEADDGFAFGEGGCPPPEKPEEPVRQFADAPQRCLAEGVDYAAVITTDLGAVTIDLYEGEAPGTVNNFVVLARYGYFDGSAFHRIIPGFVAQGGDPVGNPPGIGDPGYTIPDELPRAGAYEIGSVAMANSFDRDTGRGRDTGGSQFFIITGTSALTLPPDYPLFGEVVEGVDVMTQIDARGSNTGQPTEPVLVTSVDIVER